MTWEPATVQEPWVDVQPPFVQQNTSSQHPDNERQRGVALDSSRSHQGPSTGRPSSYPNHAISDPPPLYNSILPSELDLEMLDPSEHGHTGIQQRRGSMHRQYEVSPSDHSVHAIIGATFEEDSREGFFGSSSAGTFMQSVKKMVQQKFEGVQQPEQPSSYQHWQNLPLPASGQNAVRQKPVDYVLPSRRKADTLMLTYWEYVHVLYPYLDKMHIQDDYERLWRGDRSLPDERSLMCLLNIVFALSSQLDESVPIEERERSADVFYKRAKEMLDIVGTGSVRSVQSFLLLGQYFQSTNEPHPCWVFVGLGIRTAQSLGLHLPETSERAADIRTRELLRRVWHGCILMDRVVSMTYGRPCMIGPNAAISVPLPSPFDETHLIQGGSQSEQESVQSQQAPPFEFYALSLKLFDILHDVIFNFYSVNFQQKKPLDRDMFLGSQIECQFSVFDIDRRLLKWEENLPDRLRIAKKPQGEGVNATVYRQAVVLYQRQLHIRLLLLRPVLSNFIVSDFHDRDLPLALATLLSQRVNLQCAIVCVKVALEAISTIYRERGNNAGANGLLAAWWYNVLYLYTSATVLIAARLSSAILADVSEESILDGWHKAMEVLEGYRPFGAAINRLLTTLRLLFEAVPKQYSRFRENFRRVQPDALSNPQCQGKGKGTAALPYWRPLDPADFVSTPVDRLPREHPPDSNIAPPNNEFLDFDIDYDPNDLSWLMTIPLDA